MKYNQPYGVSDPNAPYINGNPSTGTMGSIPPAASIEYPQREIVNVIADSGLVPDNTDLSQLAKAIQSGRMNYSTDNGTLNALNVTVLPVPPPALLDGFVIIVKVAVTNTGAVVMVVNGAAAKPVMRRGGLPLLANDLRADEDHIMIYNQHFGGWMLYPAGWNGAIGVLTQNLDLYVNNAIGSDANDGISNVAGHALATTQKAVNLAFSYAPSQYVITIHVKGPGPYAGCRSPLWAGNALSIIGDGPTTTFVTAGADYGFLVQGPNTMNVTGFSVSNVSGAAGAAAFAASNGATMTTGNTASGTCGGSVFGASAGGTLSCGSHTFNGNCYAAWWASGLGTINLLQASTYSFPVFVNVAIATAFASGAGNISCSATNPVTFLGYNDVLGAKYRAGANGVVNANGQGVNFFPGNAAGYTDTGGQYI